MLSNFFNDLPAETVKKVSSKLILWLLAGSVIVHDNFFVFVNHHLHFEGSTVVIEVAIELISVYSWWIKYKAF